MVQVAVLRGPTATISSSGLIPALAAIEAGLISPNGL